MGKRSRLFKLLKVFTYFGVLALIPLLIYSLYIYFSLPTIEPKKCMTTKMFEVSLCPGSSGYATYRNISKELIDALILSEDGSFFSHKGFDWYEIKESFKENWKQGRIARGGSTITQQLAKNMYLSKDKTISRKIKEYFIANQIESNMTKAQILERYLNIVEFGPKLYGLSKAGRHYFQKAPNQLSFLESIYLVSLLPNPKSYSRGFKNRKLTSSNIYRMKIILRRFYRYKKMSQALYTHYLNLIDNIEWPFGNRFDLVPSVFSELEDEMEQIEANLEDENAIESDLNEPKSDDISDLPESNDSETISNDSPETNTMADTESRGTESEALPEEQHSPNVEPSTEEDSNKIEPKSDSEAEPVDQYI